ncbi:hypothetical protein [Altericroceibacterium xinjiangense]|uniref:hypothetical protein n=1 Tax=Altericroceibacterium xinjiangense TaxID=762261 RepID=UPI000F7E2FDA|nr:hypothetical protein [Altericroceibacterium xinjiangense]
MFRCSILFLIMLALTSCDAPAKTEGGEVGDGEQGDSWLVPRYGEQQKLSGLFRLAFEVSSFVPCTEPEACNMIYDSARDEACWMVFSETASDDLNRITGSDHFEREGVFWIEGEGRVADAPGPFGHMNSYECQVELSTVDAFVVQETLQQSNMGQLSNGS